MGGQSFIKKAKAAGAAAAFGGLALLLSGCFVFQVPPTAKQVKTKPIVQVDLTLCESDPDDPTNCDRVGNWSAGNDGDNVFVLIGLRVPKGTKMPQSFSAAKGDLLLEGTTFVQNAVYTGELKERAPANDDQRWFGYVSSDQSSNFTGDEGEGLAGRFKVRLGVPKRLVGKKFAVRPVVGASDSAVTEGWSCGENPFFATSNSGGGPNDTICINDPAEDAMQDIKVRVKAR